MTDAEEPIDVVLTVGELDGGVQAVREFLHRSGALEVQAVVDRGAAAPAALIACGLAQPIEVIDGERRVHLPHAVELDAPVPPLPAVTPMPPLDVDAADGVVTAPLGGLQHLVDAVTGLAAALGGRSVAMAFFATTDDAVPLGIAGRPGEPPVLTIGEERFELP